MSLSLFILRTFFLKKYSDSSKSLCFWGSSILLSFHCILYLFYKQPIRSETRDMCWLFLSASDLLVRIRCILSPPSSPHCSFSFCSGNFFRMNVSYIKRWGIVVTYIHMCVFQSGWLISMQSWQEVRSLCAMCTFPSFQRANGVIVLFFTETKWATGVYICTSFNEYRLLSITAAFLCDIFLFHSFHFFRTRVVLFIPDIRYYEPEVAQFTHV